MKKEVTIDGMASDWFEKATFTLKDSGKVAMPKDLTSYAEELIENYMKRVPQGNMEMIMQAEQAYKKQKAYQDKGASNRNSSPSLSTSQLLTEYEKLKEKRAIIKRRERYVNRFVALSLIACLLSVLALIFSYI